MSSSLDLGICSWSSFRTHMGHPWVQLLISSELEEPWYSNADLELWAPLSTIRTPDKNGSRNLCLWTLSLQVPQSFFRINSIRSLLLPLQVALRAHPQSKTKAQIWPTIPRSTLCQWLWLACEIGSGISCPSLPEHQVCAQGGTD